MADRSDAHSAGSESARTAKERRQALDGWMYWTADRKLRLTTAQIASVSGIYDGLQGRYDKCRTDLLALKRAGVVKCSGRPARWTHSHA